MYQYIMEFADECKAMDFIINAPQTPHPSIYIEYVVGNRRIKSSMEFMSFGEKGDAKNIFSWRGDWINIEEAGRIDGLSDIVATLSTRLTGSTSEGRPYLGRMSLISNPLDNPELWQMYDIAMEKENGLALSIETKDNLNTTLEQVENMKDLIPEDQQIGYVTGKRPEGKLRENPPDLYVPYS